MGTWSWVTFWTRSLCGRRRSAPRRRGVVAATEIAEVINLSHRVLVMYGGRIAKELDDSRGEITEAEIMRAALGEARGLAAASTEEVSAA